ncbi:hypothetical protein AAFF_G00019800 [Aldrovandia affinis]|uniref:Ig-like domain-containing protein n=1 Tax=Aldrovandia affinis TaxID=143900 RepID=A0AAD7WGY3_9TELE|nr:hypothetical protein AAFF_G00019800 [Aldrovandia affinis]
MNIIMAVLVVVLSSTLSPVLSAKVRADGTTTADFGKEASFSCSLSESDGASQVTWQRLIKDNPVEKLATFSKRFGAKIMDPFGGRIHFTEASLNSTSIIIKNVTPSDEACYICSFSVYPSGSIWKQTCLTVQGIFEVKAWRTPSDENSPEHVVVSCSATGKPAPDITWSSTVEMNAVPEVERVSKKDGIVTVTSKLTLRLSEFSGSSVDCLLATYNITRTITLPEARTPEIEGRSHFSSTWIIIILVIILTITISVAYIVSRLKRKKGDKKAKLFQGERRPDLLLNCDV